MRQNLSKIDGEYAITSARRVGGTRKSRTRCIALTDCVCYDAAGNVIKTIARNTVTKKVNRAARTKQVTTSAARRDILLQATMGTIHDVG